MLNKKLVQEMQRAPWRLIGVLFFSTIGTLATLAQYWGIAHIVNDVFLAGAGRLGVRHWFQWTIFFLVLRIVARLLEEHMALLLAFEIKKGLREALLEAMQTIGPLQLLSHSSGALMNVYFDGVDKLETYFKHYLPQLLKSALIPLIFLMVVFPKDWISGLIFLLTLPLIPFFMILIGRWTKRIAEQQWGLLSNLAAYLQDVLQGIETLKLLGRSKAQGRKIHEISERYRVATLKVQRWAFLSALALELLATISIALIAVGLGLRLVDGSLDFLSAFFILLVAPEYYQPVRELGGYFHTSMDADAVAESVYDLLAEGMAEENAATDTLGAFASLRFEKVSYTYPGHAQAALSDVSFTLHRGEQLALVGKSGSGKTTLFHLAMGLLTPTSGDIFINEQPLSEVRKNWQKQFSLVPQEVTEFSVSLAENISLWDDGHTDAPQRIEKAAQESGLAELIKGLPAGLDTRIGQGGVALSGGQKALLALARSIYDDRPMLFLDEATDGLDLGSEQKVMACLRRLYQEKTALAIAHRLHTVQEASEILVLHEGRVVERGDYGALLKKGTHFRNLLRRGEDE